MQNRHEERKITHVELGEMVEVAPTVAIVATTELCHRAGCFRSGRSFFVPFVETFDGGGRLSELELS